MPRPPSPASAKAHQDILFGKVSEKDMEKFSPQKVKRWTVILTNANLQFDWEKNCFVINDAEGLLKIYRDNGCEDECYEEAVQEVLQAVNKKVEKICSGAKLDKIIVRDPITTKQQIPIAGQKKYYASSPLRNIDKRYNLTNFVDSMTQAKLIDEIIGKIIHDLNFDPSCYQTLQPKFSQSVDAAVYHRDYYITAGEHLFQIDPRIIQEIKDEDFLPKIFVEYREACQKDLLATGLKIENLPFVLEGGNFVVCKNKDGRDTMLIALSEVNFAGEDWEFVGSFVAGEDGSINNCDRYDELANYIKNWGESLGYEVVIVERNLEKHDLISIYHLDTFCNVAQLYEKDKVTNILFIPEDEEEIITKESRDQLIEVFGEENIIRISEYDRKMLCSNFIQIENTIILTHPETSFSFIEKLNERGFQVVVPPIALKMGPKLTDGIRCHTQDAPSSFCEVPQSNQVLQDIVEKSFD